jgi:hypothetical protein
MDEKRKVLLTTSIIVDLPENDDDVFERVEPICEKLRTVVESLFNDDESVQATGVIAYDWFGEPTTNVGRCTRCNEWVTNREKPHELRGLSSATLVDGKLVCDQCR